MENDYKKKRKVRPFLNHKYLKCIVNTIQTTNVIHKSHESSENIIYQIQDFLFIFLKLPHDKEHHPTKRTILDRPTANSHANGAKIVERGHLTQAKLGVEKEASPLRHSLHRLAGLLPIRISLCYSLTHTILAAA